MKKRKLNINVENIGEANPDKENLTSEKLKSFPGLEGLSDDQAKETVFALQTFASILYDFAVEQTKNKIRNLNEVINTNQLKIAA